MRHSGVHSRVSAGVIMRMLTFGMAVLACVGLASALEILQGAEAEGGSKAASVGVDNDARRDPSLECELWLAPSTLPGVQGRGVISGVPLLNSTALEPLVTLSVPYELVRYWSLANYVFAHEEEEQSLVVFGIGMLINHLSNPALYHYWSEDDPAHSSESYWTPSTMSSSVVYETLRDVKKGEELFISYGDSEWFEDRGITLSKETDRDESTPPVLVPDEYLNKNSHCLTDVFVSESDKPMTFYGLFARRHFKKGEIVTISPLLPLPAEEVESVWDESVLMNYCISSPGSKVAMLPIGYAAMMNHDLHANVKMDWYSWPKHRPPWASADNSTFEFDNEVGLGDNNLQKCLDADPAALIFDSDFSAMDMKFVATRDIAPEEEITLDYGVDWINKWADYMSASLSYHAKEAASERDASIFRAFIQAPDGLFPERWKYYAEPEKYYGHDEDEDHSSPVNVNSKKKDNEQRQGQGIEPQQRDGMAAAEGLNAFHQQLTSEEL